MVNANIRQTEHLKTNRKCERDTNMVYHTDILQQPLQRNILAQDLFWKVTHYKTGNEIRSQVLPFLSNTSKTFLLIYFFSICYKCSFYWKKPWVVTSSISGWWFRLKSKLALTSRTQILCKRWKYQGTVRLLNVVGIVLSIFLTFKYCSLCTVKVLSYWRQ